MQMQYRSVCFVVALLVSCSDNHQNLPDGGGGPPDAGDLPDAGNIPPDTGGDLPDAGGNLPDGGGNLPDNTPPDSALADGALPDGSGGPSDAGTPDSSVPADGGTSVCRLDLDGSALTGSWDPRFTIAGFTGHDGRAPTVYDFARDIDGSIVATGAFQYLGSTRVEPLLRLRDGVWRPARTTWELTPPGSGFSAIAIDTGGRLALATGDDFGPRSGQIWLDDGSGLRVIGAFGGMIRRLHWFRGKLWAAGWMQLKDKSLAQGLAVWDGTAWAAPPGGAPDGFAFELVDDGAELLVGGAFNHIGGLATSAVAAFDGTAWRPMSFPGVAVYALSRAPDGQLYAGGAFGNLGRGAGGFARWTGDSWTLAAGGVVNRNFPGVVTDLVAHAGSLYVSGCFHTVGGGVETLPIVSTSIARFDGTWHSLDDGTRSVLAPWFEPRACGDEGDQSVWDVSRQAMFSAGDQLLLGGSFPGIAGTLSQSVIGYDGTAWRAQSSSGLGLGGSLDRVAVSSSCDVWGAGQLSHVAGVPTHARVVHFTGNAWQPIADAIPSDAFCPGFGVSPAGDVALGCMVFPADGGAVGRVYRVDGDQLVQLGDDQPPIQALSYGADGTLWIAGGGATGFLARFDGDAFTMVEDQFDAAVMQIDPVGPREVLVGGLFSEIGDVAASRVARWNGTAWSALGDGLPGMPTALAHDGATVYTSTFDEGSGAYMLGAFDGTAWHELATPAAGLTPVPFFNFNAIEVIDGAVLAVGTAELDDHSGRGALVYRGGRFTPLGGGVHAIGLSGLAVTHNDIWVAGVIAEAGATGTTTPSVGVAHYVIAR